MSDMAIFFFKAARRQGNLKNGYFCMSCVGFMGAIFKFSIMISRTFFPLLIINNNYVIIIINNEIIIIIYNNNKL